jgi:hypothetical protein
MKVSTQPLERAEHGTRAGGFYARHVFVDIPSYGVLPEEMKVESVVRFQQGADTKEIASELEVHESRVYNHLARERESGR